MSTPRDFKAEYQAYRKEYPYQTMQVNGIPVRYQFGGKEGAPVMAACMPRCLPKCFHRRYRR